MSHDDPATKKYQQIVVPDHALKPDTSGTSFLRTGTFPSLTDATKQPPGFQKSLALARLGGEHHLKTGGSWHHVDGNRIETTTGRKVEVIRGSYVSHRGPGNSPGPVLTVTWPSQSYTQTGSEDLPAGWEPNTDAQGQVIVNAQNEETGATPPSPATNDPAGLASTLSRHYKESYDDPSSLKPGIDTTDSAPIQKGDVVTTSWAQRILTYVGSTNRSVPLVYAETHADSYHSYSYYSTESNTYVGSSDNPVPTVYAETHAASIVTKNRAENVVQDTTSVAITTTQEAAAAITVLNTAPNILTQNVGIQEVLNLAPAMVTATAGVAVATLTAAEVVATLTAASFITVMNFGVQTTINFPEDQQFTLSQGKIVAASQEMDGVHEDIKGLKSEIDGVHQHMATAANIMRGMVNEMSDTRTELSNVGMWVASLMLQLGL